MSVSDTGTHLLLEVSMLDATSVIDNLLQYANKIAINVSN